MTASPPSGNLSPALRIALVSMPWPIFNRPSIQLGALKAYLEREADWLRVDLMHPYLAVAQRLGSDRYHALSLDSWCCEALYSRILFGDASPVPPARLQAQINRTLAARGLSPMAMDALSSLLDEELDNLLGADWSPYQLVGFSVCFNQLLASLAAARRLHRLRPDLSIVFGGSACSEANAQTICQLFPEVDRVLPGEGETQLLALCAGLKANRQRNWAESPAENRKPFRLPPAVADRPVQVANPDTLPLPDYTEYFKEMQSVFCSGTFIPTLPVEFSRGCWWGRCAFCNLNLQWCGYRFKSARRMRAEVDELCRRHGCLDFAFCDNVLPPAAAESFFQSIDDDGLDYSFFAEIRASDRYLRQQDTLALFRSGGLQTVQVGIEGLSDGLLDRLGKGTTVMDNMVMMKSALEAGIALEGNLITEFPGSTAAEVEETLAALPFLLPFNPLATARFFLGQGSPVEKEPEKFGISAVGSEPRFEALLPPAYRKRSLFLLRGYRADRSQQRRLWRPVQEAVRSWHSFHAEHRDKMPFLSYRDAGSVLVIRQVLPTGQVLHHRLQGLSRKLYLACDLPRSVKELAAKQPQLTPEKITTFFENLQAKRLVYGDGRHYLALAVHRR